MVKPTMYWKVKLSEINSKESRNSGTKEESDTARMAAICPDPGYVSMVARATGKAGCE